jgi:hypothetical protein
MKKSFLAIALLGLLASGSRDVQAQAYDPYWDAIQYRQYLQYQQYLASLQPYDPYYELHVMHYQLYRQQFGSYQLHQVCCYAWGVPLLERSTPIGPASRPVIGSRSQTVVGTAPRAVSPLPRATGRR